MSKLHLVFGGRVKDPRGLDFVDLNAIDLVGIYDSFAAAEEAWRGKAQGSVDDAEMKYVIVHLHRLLEPGMEGTISGIERPKQTAGG
jgi:hypothetical protein